ncbi:MAG: hypothetical protein HC874_14325 [Richelia sp. SL_2_1]|nr:hypothetical protein [Richelia sp. SL_2_1]
MLTKTEIHAQDFIPSAEQIQELSRFLRGMVLNNILPPLGTKIALPVEGFPVFQIRDLLLVPDEAHDMKMEVWLKKIQ